MTLQRFDLIQRPYFRPQIEMRQADDPAESQVAGKIMGVACTYNTPDFFSTMFAPGCFDRTRAEKIPAGKVQLFRDHDHTSRSHVGTVRDCPDVGNAMMMHAECFANDEGQAALDYCKSVLAADGFTGLSVGVYVRNAEWRPNPQARDGGDKGSGVGDGPASPSEQEPRSEGKTKKVDGEELSAGDFIIVGDTDDPSTWKLPWHFSSDEKTKSHLRNALARFNQMTGISAETKKAAWTKLKRLCKEHGIDVSDEKSIDYSPPAGAMPGGGSADSASSIYTFTECELAEISITPMPAVPGTEIIHARHQPVTDVIRQQLVALRVLMTALPRPELEAVAKEFGLGMLVTPTPAPRDANGHPPTDSETRRAAELITHVPLDERLAWIRQTYPRTLGI